MSEMRTWYTFHEKNKKGESAILELTKIYPDNTRKNSLPRLWKKAGYMDRVLKSYICIDTYITDKDGNCYERYNPQIRQDSHTINFDYMFEVSEENEEKLLNAFIERFTGVYEKNEIEKVLQR